MRRPAGLTPGSRMSHGQIRIGVVEPRNLFEETLTRMSRKCECSNRVKRSPRSGRRRGREDKQMARLQRLLRRESRRKNRRKSVSKSRSQAKVSRKQDHCSADVKMNCFR